MAVTDDVIAVSFVKSVFDCHHDFIPEIEKLRNCEISPVKFLYAIKGHRSIELKSN